METYRIKDLSFSYPKRENRTLDGINLTIKKGEFITIIGQSGSGKTTLLRLLKPLIAPKGTLGGSIYFNGVDISLLKEREMAEKIGFVMQNPDNQIVSDKVWHELSFSLESLGVESEKIRTKVSEMATFFGMEEWFYKKTSELSGGQKQILNLASTLVASPDVLILDEPLSQLDPVASEEFMGMLNKINEELGTTIIISEHNLDLVLPLSDRVVVLDNGQIIADDTPQGIGKTLKEKRHEMWESLPVSMRIAGSVESEKLPLTVNEGRTWLGEYLMSYTPCESKVEKDGEVGEKESAISLKDIVFKYEKNGKVILDGLSLSVKKGEFLTLLGGNGVGKSTALSVISGIEKAQSGKVKVNGTIGYLPQNPQALFLKDTVKENLLYINKDIDEVTKLCRIDHLLDSHPYDLSGGEKERVALAMVLLRESDILILDEPTKGMDAYFKKELKMIFDSLKSSGKTILMVSHDIEFASNVSDRCALLFGGSITGEGKVREFFSGNRFYTTKAHRMARDIIPGAVLTKDVINAIGGAEDEIKVKDKLKPKRERPALKEKEKRRVNILPILILLFLVPLTLFLGNKFLGERKYTLISFAIILETIAVFFIGFEKRRPKAREIVLIATLSAIAVAGRLVFYMIPQFKPVVAIVIIAGIALNAETGFLVGAVTAFISNFFFGQGMWTPWQMFALGVIGILASLIKVKKPLFVALFGFLVTLVVYGTIMNTASILMYQANPTWEMLVASMVAGFPMDIVHAVSTFLFLILITKPMLSKIERIKTKYKLYD